MLYGDGPLVKIKTLKKLISRTSGDNLSLLTFEASNPKGLGRIIRQTNSKVVGIVEEKDASASER